MTSLPEIAPPSARSVPELTGRYVLDVRRPGQRQPRLPRGPRHTRQGPTPCVLLLSRSCDAELDGVGRLLTKVGVSAARIDADELAAMDLLVDPEHSAMRLDGTWLIPTVTWNRHFSACAIDPAGSPADDLFNRESWQAVASQLSALSWATLGARRVGLLEQQSQARRWQIATPRTVVTTDPERARGILRTRRIVIKAVNQHFVEASPGRLSGVFPVIAGHAEPLSAPWPGTPVIAQEYVEHDAEFRVYYVDGEVLGFQVSKEAPADLWLAPDRVEVRPIDLPPQVIAAASLLATGLALRFGAFDFLLRGGTPVFLEVNPDGDWRWAEEKAGREQVTMAVSRMLRRLHEEALARELPAGCRRAASFDLLRFLSSGSS